VVCEVKCAPSGSDTLSETTLDRNMVGFTPVVFTVHHRPPLCERVQSARVNGHEVGCEWLSAVNGVSSVDRGGGVFAMTS